MPRKAKVVTTSSFGAGGPTVTANLQWAVDCLELAGKEGADLVCLPEDFLTPDGEAQYSEPPDGPVFEALAASARTHRMWVVACYIVEVTPGQRQVCAVVINRSGELAGRYAKAHPTIWECEDWGITPGQRAAVVQTDFGRVGLAICYDINWPGHWAELAAGGAELVIWPSAYDGGFPLQAYAWRHFYSVVSSVRSENAKVIDLTGRIITQTSKWHRTTSATVDLEKEVFHIDLQIGKLHAIKQELGPRVSIDALSEENVFTIESNDKDWPLSRIKREWGLENVRDYLERAERVQDEHRAAAPRPTSGGAAGA